MTDLFTMTVPTEELAPQSLKFKPTPTGLYAGAINGDLSEPMENAVATWAGFRIGAVIAAASGGETEVRGVNIAGRSVDALVTTESWEATGVGDDRIPTIDDNGEKVERTDYDWQGDTARLLTQLFVAVGAIEAGSSLGDLGISDRAGLIEAVKGYDGVEVGFSVRTSKRTEKIPGGKRKRVVTNEVGEPFWDSRIVDFWAVGNPPSED